jgi:hypothetical protein
MSKFSINGPAAQIFITIMPQHFNVLNFLAKFIKLGFIPSYRHLSVACTDIIEHCDVICFIVKSIVAIIKGSSCILID